MPDGSLSSHVGPLASLSSSQAPQCGQAWAWEELRPGASRLPTDSSKNVTFVEHYPLGMPLATDQSFKVGENNGTLQGYDV